MTNLPVLETVIEVNSQRDVSARQRLMSGTISKTDISAIVSDAVTNTSMFQTSPHDGMIMINKFRAATAVHQVGTMMGVSQNKICQD